MFRLKSRRSLLVVSLILVAAIAAVTTVAMAMTRPIAARPRAAIAPSPPPTSTAAAVAPTPIVERRTPAVPPTPHLPLIAPGAPPAPDLRSLVPGPLDGLPTPRGLALRRPLAIMVENYYPDARPQTGLVEASVVFETVAEWGITRFMALYEERDAAVVGPVRSARVYYDHWADGMQAIYVHAGGNSDAIRELWVLKNLLNIDELFTEKGLVDTGSDYFFRSTARQAPHNLYTYPDRVRARVASLGEWTVGDPPWVLPHKAEAALEQRPSGGRIDMTFSTAPFAVHYDYDRGTNTYLRSMGGTAHVDAVSGVRIAPKNVVVLLAGVRPDMASDTLGSIVVQSEGQGTAYYFMDGTVRQGLWRKAGIAQPLQLLDGRGQAEQLNPGQTWVEVVPQGNTVSWSALPAR